jgi:hypothetical protein
MRLHSCCVFLVLLVHVAVTSSCRDTRNGDKQSNDAEQEAIDAYVASKTGTSTKSVHLRRRDDISHLIEHLSSTKVPIVAFEVANQSPRGVEVSSSLPWPTHRYEFVVVRNDKAYVFGGRQSSKELDDLLRSLSIRALENQDKVKLSKMCWLMTHGFELNTYSGEQELRALLIKQLEFKGLTPTESARVTDQWARDVDRLGFSHPLIESQGTDTIVSLFDVAGLLGTDRYEGPYLSKVDVRIKSNGTCKPQEGVTVYPR